MADYEGLTVFNYRLTRKLGEGGFGVVYLAEHVDMGRKAACKLLHPEFARQPQLVERFFREVRAVCAIEHPAILDIQNFGRLESGEPFYLMEYFPGVDLRAFIARRGPLPLDRVGEVFEPIAQALALAHANQVIHRDLKPENIMIREHADRLEVRLLDFGIAKLMDSRTTGASRTGIALGTPTYMAPEQARDAKSVDPRADVYSFAATIYSALCGRPPFAHENLTDLIIAVQTQAPLPLQRAAPHVPAALDAVIARCLAKHPDGRPPTITAAWEEIRAALGPATGAAALGPQGAPPVGPAYFTPPTPHSHPLAAQRTPGSSGGQVSGGPERPARRRALPVAGGAAVAVAVLVLLLVIAGRGDEEPTRGPTASLGKPPASPRPVEATPAATTPAATTPAATIPAAPTPAPTTLAAPVPAAPVPAPAEPTELPPTKAEKAMEKTAAPLEVAEPPPSRPKPSPSRSESQAEGKSRDDETESKGKSSRDCSPSSFARVYESKTVDTQAIQSALLRLRKCSKARKMDDATFKRIQQALLNRI
jgi:hypothetical protein